MGSSLKYLGFHQFRFVEEFRFLRCQVYGCKVFLVRLCLGLLELFDLFAARLELDLKS